MWTTKMDDKMLAKLVFIFTFIFTSGSMLEIKEDVIACENQKTTLDFEFDTSKEAAVRYKKSGNKSEPVAQELKGEKEYFNNNRVVILQDRSLFFKNVSKMDEGLYIGEITNGDKKEVHISLKVYVSPNGMPKIRNFTDISGHVFLKCEGPPDLGKPKATLVAKDSMDRKMDDLSYTFNNDEYKCCLEGESVRRCYPEDMPTCVTYKMKATTTEGTTTLPKVEIKLGTVCESARSCKAVSVIYWFVSAVLLLLLMAFIREIGTGAGPCKSLWQGNCIVTEYCANLKEDKRFLCSCLVCFAISLSAVVIMSGYLCSKPDCANTFYQCLIGFVCSLLILAVPLLNRMEMNMIRNKKRQKRIWHRRKKGQSSEESRIVGSLETRALMDDSTDEEMTDFEQDVSDHCKGLDTPESRRQLRKYKKIGVLRTGLSHTLWNVNQKETIKLIFKPEYMSSEESEYEDDEKTRTRVRKRYKIKRISWENKKMTTLKESLYKWYEVYEGKSRYEPDKFERRQCDEVSTRPIPKDAPEWAVVGSESEFLEFLTSDNVVNLIDFT